MNGTRKGSLWGAISLGLAVSALAISCEMSSGLLSESERSSIYSLSVATADGASIFDGAVVNPGTAISVTVVKRSGASDPAALDCSLAKPDGSPAASLRFVVQSADSGKAKQVSALSSKSVAGIAGRLDGFSIPASQDPGVYQLDVAVSGADGSVLERETISLFIGRAKPAIDSVSVFPPSVEPGASVLLGLTLSWIPLPSADSSEAAVKDAADPWIKWSRDGSVFAEGFQSAGFAKVVWTAPRIEGAYSIRAEVFPSGPGKGGAFSFKSAASQDLRVMVIAAPGGSGNDFSDPLSFYSLLKLDGSFDDSGTRPRSAQPEAFGSPSLDTYSSGFGYRFGSKAGVSIPGLMPPSASGSLAGFAVLLRLDPDRGDGSLVRFASADSSYSITLGLKDGRPYAETRIAGKTQSSVGVSPLPQGPLTLEALFKPEGDELAISWRAEGERIEAPSLPLPSAPPAGSATLGGVGSLPGVYDGFGLMVAGASSTYPSPTYRLASRRLYKSSLIIAEGFDDEAEQPSSIVLSPAFGIGAGVAVEAGIEGDRAGCLLEFSTPEGEKVFTVRGTGEVLDAAVHAIGSIPVSGAKLAFSLEQREGRVFLLAPGKAASLAIPGTDKRFSLTLKREGGATSAFFDRILVRCSSSSAGA